MVQGVGFRPWVYRLAREEGIAGRVRNDPQGVTIEAFGARDALDEFLRRLRASPPPAARIEELRALSISAEWDEGFRIVDSGAIGERRVSIPPDLATCEACVREIFEPSDRRYRHPFANCTSCGPRFTIAEDVPYDRATTSMAGFVMCAACREEYEDAENRRFHAQPNSCPACGPQLELLRPSGERVVTDDPLATVAELLRDGGIVAVKGLGGFHLACDATRSDVVGRLRERKKRDEKPFAVMTRDLAAAGRIVWVGEQEALLLASPERPIVIVSVRSGSGLAPEVAPGNPTVGLLLPYSPLHHLLLADAGRPLVMTSGNLSDEPMVFRDDEALARLGEVADLLLTHDREIRTRCDDSVARVIAGSPVVFRRSRGYVPRPIPVPGGFERPVLACGGHLKNTFCLASSDAAWMGPHIGDLENAETLGALADTVERLERFLQVRPEIVAHDLHPDYLSTRYALRRPELLKVGVQHHHAHVASAMAEHGLSGQVLGVAYDGTGYGTDGMAWGGEILVARYEGFERLATFRPLRLPGGEAAIREVWRLALAMVDDALGNETSPEAIPVLRGIAADRIAVVRRLVARGVNSPQAHGVGRVFDAFGALVLGRPRASFEGQVALEWNLAADPREPGRYGYRIDWQADPWQLDLRPLVRETVSDLLAGCTPGVLSGRFHNTLAAATAELIGGAIRHRGRLPVVLTGGCFQNALLTEKVLQALQPDLEVYIHGEVPPGDGGLCLGQAVVADAIGRGSR